MQALRIWAQRSACSKWKTKEDGAVDTERRLLLTLLLPSASALVLQLTDVGTCACSLQSHLMSVACGGGGCGEAAAAQNHFFIACRENTTFKLLILKAKNLHKRIWSRNILRDAIAEGRFC